MSTSGTPAAVHGEAAKQKKPRLDHIDAMRPVKQCGVVTTHSSIFFAPGALIGVGGALMLLHVTREAFLFISACMLTYSYADLHQIGYRYFYKRRFVTVAVPYVCWTVIYFLVTLPGTSFGPIQGIQHFGFLLGTGYYQLYYLVVIMEFYLLFPALMWVIRRLSGHHLAILVVSLALQVVILSLMHWKVVPSHMQGYWATREVISYEFYLVGGVIAALHLDQFHRWLCDHGWRVFFATVLAAVVAEVWYVAAYHHVVSWLGSPSDPLQPIAIPFNIGAIACVYLFGVWLVAPQRPAWIRAVAHSGSDNSYGIYLMQMLFIYALADLGWHSLDRVLPWPIVSAAGVAIVVLLCVLVTSVVARTPFAVAITGRKRERWATWIPKAWRSSTVTELHVNESPIDPAPSAQGAWTDVASAGANRR